MFFNTYLGMTLLGTFVLSLLFVGSYRQLAVRFGVLAKNNTNEVHKQRKPVGAGIVFIGLWILYIAYTYMLHFFDTSLLRLLLLPLGILVFISFLDDCFNLPIGWRLLMQFFVALLFLFYLQKVPYLDFGWFSSHYEIINFSLALLALIWSINLYNFMDGVDGMAALQGCFIFTMGGILFYISGAYLYALFCLVLAASVLGFLFWNWPVAKIFMGDVGSTSLGFLIIVFCLLGQKEHHLSVVLWFMLYELFFIDATFTLIRRFLHKEPVYHAHKKFAFHRLHDAGWSNRKILYSIIFIDIFIALLTLLAYTFPFWMLPLCLLETVILISIYLSIEKKNPMYTK